MDESTRAPDDPPVTTPEGSDAPTPPADDAVTPEAEVSAEVDAASALLRDAVDQEAATVEAPAATTVIDVAGDPTADDRVAEPAEPVDDDVVLAAVAAAPVHRDPWWSRLLDRPLDLISFGVALAAAVFVFVQLRPGLLLADTTPSGGDMGAHVWGPAFLRDELLSQGRITGWTPDWYAGFPAYQFYMVVPSLAIVLLNAGLTPWIGVPIGFTIVGAAIELARRVGRHGGWIITLGVLVGLGLIGLPYGIAFKLVSVSGLVMFPIAAWFMARLAGSPDPVPAFVSLGATIFLFDTNFTIYGGNIASTLAGEFAFSVSLCLALLAVGLVAKGLDDDRYRAPAAVVIALVALCHVIPLFFVVPVLILLVVQHHSVPRGWLLGLSVTVALAAVAPAESSGLGYRLLVLVPAVFVYVLILTANPESRRRAGWLLTVGPVAFALTAFWLLPFTLREPYLNDMGWERLTTIADSLLTDPMRVALPVAVVGAILAFGARERLGVVFATNAALFAGLIATLPEARLWNARLLPFFYLPVYLVAAVGVAFVVRAFATTLSERYDRPDPWTVMISMVVGLSVVIVGIAIPLRAAPGGGIDDEGRWTWLGIESKSRSFLPSWIAWNYSGYEEKNSYREYSDVVSTMGDVGLDNGCGRAMWEYDKDLDRYGTPMALMLLPHWTDGCIGSMEGLYFESSATTPFHFLNQSVLSAAPSRAQRDLPYRGFDIGLGVDQLETLGVRYYMALSDEAIRAARDEPRLTEVAESAPWIVFEVAEAAIVEGLTTEPVVTGGPDESTVGELATHWDTGWVSQAVVSFNERSAAMPLPAEDGPDEWQRAVNLADADAVELPPVTVSDIVTDTDKIAFTVDEPGVPVLVKASYFPNWSASGAEGPWRVGPNMMVVVPTDTEVEIRFGYSAVEYGSYALTALGLAALVGLGVLDRRRRTGGAEPAVVGAGADVAAGEASVAPVWADEVPAGAGPAEATWADEVPEVAMPPVEDEPESPGGP